jgi:hypothetical protein
VASATSGQYQAVSYQRRAHPLWIRAVVIVAVLFIVFAVVAAAFGH